MRKILLLTIILIVMLLENAFAAEYSYRTVPEQKLRVTVDYLNVRTGPGMEYPVVRVVKRNQVFDIIGTLKTSENTGIWYITLMDDGTVGVVSKDFVECFDFNVDVVKSGEEPSLAKLQEMINGVRSENKLPKFKTDDRVNGIAQMKAEDMAENLCVDHVSKRYGTPFVMLKESGVLYKSASETIERNVTAEEAYNNMISSQAGRSNINNARFNKLGIGISLGSDGYYYYALLFIEE